MKKKKEKNLGYYKFPTNLHDNSYERHVAQHELKK